MKSRSRASHDPDAPREKFFHQPKTSSGKILPRIRTKWGKNGVFRNTKKPKFPALRRAKLVSFGTRVDIGFARHVVIQQQ